MPMQCNALPVLKHLLYPCIKTFAVLPINNTIIPRTNTRVVGAGLLRSTESIKTSWYGSKSIIITQSVGLY